MSGVELPQNTFDSRSQANEKMREGFLMFAEMAPGSNPTRSVSREGMNSIKKQQHQSFISEQERISVNLFLFS